MRSRNNAGKHEDALLLTLGLFTLLLYMPTDWLVL